MQEGIQLPELLLKITDLREAGQRAAHVAFSFMKRRVHPLMARDTLGYQCPSTSCMVVVMLTQAVCCRMIL
jgi:hypothetical protein